MKTKSKVIISLAIVFTVIGFFLFKNSNKSSSETTDSFVDQNGNGVRDDVEAKILDKYGYSNNFKNALFQAAKAFQKASSEKNMIKARALEIGIESVRGTNCIESLDPELEDAELEVEGWVVNTKERAKIYTHYNALLSGEIVDEGTNLIMCDFELEK